MTVMSFPVGTMQRSTITFTGEGVAVDPCWKQLRYVPLDPIWRSSAVGLDGV